MGRSSANHPRKQETQIDGTGETLSYDDFTKVSPEYQFKDGMSYLYGAHPIERVFETLRTIFKKLMIRDIDIAEHDEEADKDSLEISSGRFDEEPPSNNESPQNQQDLEKLQKNVFRFFNRYITILDKHREKKYKVNVLHSSMFAIALHLLIDLLDRPMQGKKSADKGNHKILLSTAGRYSDRNDYCHIVTEIIGKFTMLLINGFDDANDEYVRQRIEKCRRIAYWHSLSCIARLVPYEYKGEDFSDYSSLWKWELGMNLRHFYAPENADNEITAREEFEYRIRMMTCGNNSEMLARCMKVWQEIEHEYKNYKKLAETPPVKQYYTKNARIFCKPAGFAHIFRAQSTNTPFVWLARPGYTFSEEDRDFQEDRKFLAEKAHVLVLD
ncbi:hypothetical protein [Chitinivibrio alkaliphilus]|uniref:Uncharacterized protein n=1 Tax=Chitinivibrio alkaliphilus ACht1 TaxID=1313304 RepID=U7D729_9BACT|nr:hypothetical protein [Chitinivibrio alkaliphilus]ERP31753.1 hypothetical protein CALK_1418 [Chitinivibrio alkaliphilus ACht1]